MGTHSHAHRIKISVDVSEEERTYIKMIAAKKNMTISEFIMSFVRPNIPQPNAETKKAMKDIEENKNLTRYKNIDDFWADMGLDPNA
jgi:antitoxin component of RelBE/YafQ-DinJ toxin-antitoxin module